MPIKTQKVNDIAWHYIAELGDVELAFLKDNFKFHNLDFKDLQGEFQRSKLDIYRNYIFLVFQMPHDTTSGAATQPGREDLVFVFAGKDYVVTITPNKNRHFNNLYYKVTTNSRVRDEFFSKGSGFLVYKILDRHLKTVWNYIYRLDAPLRTLENRIDEGMQRRLVFEIAQLRRQVLRYKALSEPQRQVIHSLTSVEENFLGKDLAKYYDDIDDFIEKISSTLQSYEDRIMSLQDINESLISYQTNSVMKILTMFSVALLPLTLLSGIYGMNIDNLPFAHSPGLIWTIFSALALLIVGIIVYLRHKDWI